MTKSHIIKKRTKNKWGRGRS